jgi:nicotinamide-nucleotide amidase
MTELTDLAGRLLAVAKRHNLTIATAESCTAGCLATLLADAPLGGQFFHGGIVAYTKENKIAALGVAPEVLAAHTAVSPPVAAAMAIGAIERSPADIAIAITGVAGPEPDEDGNPVGLMHIAVAVRSGTIRHRECTFDAGRRDPLRLRAIQAALELAHETLEDFATLSRLGTAS